jgi:carbonic anhydrase
MERQSDHRACRGSFDDGQPAALKGGFGIALDGAVDAAWRSMPCPAVAAGPDALIEGLKKDNARFRSGRDHNHDYITRKQARGSGRFPAAVLLSCIDSRATTAELIPDSGIGDTFNAGIAGDIANEDLSGSQAFICAAAASRATRQTCLRDKTRHRRPATRTDAYRQQHRIHSKGRERECQNIIHD